MRLSLVGMLLLAACGGPGQSTPTALPASLVRPVQPTPAYPASVQEFTLTATATSTMQDRSAAARPLDGAAQPVFVTSVPPAVLVMAQPPTALGIVAGGPAAVLAQPGGALLATLPVGSALTVTGRSADGSYLAVFTAAGVAGWVANEAIVLFGADDLTAVTAPANLGPVATLIAQALEPVDVQMRRFEATRPVAGAPAPAAAVESAAAGTVISAGRLNVRAAPDTEAAVIGQLLPGDAVQVMGRTADGRWLRIGVATGDGWVFADYVALDVPGEAAPLASPAP